MRLWEIEEIYILDKMSVLNYNLYEDMTRESILRVRVDSFCY